MSCAGYCHAVPTLDVSGNPDQLVPGRLLGSSKLLGTVPTLDVSPTPVGNCDRSPGFVALMPAVYGLPVLPPPVDRFALLPLPIDGVAPVGTDGVVAGVLVPLCPDAYALASAPM